ncbi:MAG TPA: DUF5683 domain-containing protein [Candidatus Cloacimonadota bacterium]|nr:DUF5683 domain-containing protein [Candidatus Cloacimonadota bacterium]
MKHTRLILIPLLCLIWLIPNLCSAKPLSQPTKALLLSAVFPGGGQLYNHAWIKAGVVMGVHGYLITSAVQHDAKLKDYRTKALNSTDPLEASRYKQLEQRYTDRFNNDVWWIGITAALSMIDAFVDAHLKDFDANKQDLRLRFSGSSLSLEYNF